MTPMIWKSELVGMSIVAPRRGSKTYAVPEPVGGGGQSDTLGTDGEREDLANDDPSGRTPGGSERGEVDAGEGDQAAAGSVGAGVGSTDNGNDELTHQHDGGTVDEERTTTKLLDGVEGERSGGDVDDIGDDGDEEGVLDADLLEEGGAVVDWRALVQIADLKHTQGNLQMKLTPVHCWNICMRIPMRTRRKLPLDLVMPPLKQSTHELAATCFSYS